MPPAWSYGVTTCPRRINDLLPRTLASLAAGGFPNPVVFADGVKPNEWWPTLHQIADVICRPTQVGVVGNWILSAWELYLREPRADRYAIFQDDLVCYRNLRPYLDRCPYPDKGYCNLYTFPSNQEVAPRHPGTGQTLVGWFRGRDIGTIEGNPDRFQLGKGAVALVFTRDALHTLLSSRHLVCKPASAEPRMATACIDGGVVTAMNLAGWSEYVHHPSLVQHTGVISTHSKFVHPEAVSFHGEQFDALTLLEEQHGRAGG
jgi:hypothetical protein